jgi:hypothetical protein
MDVAAGVALRALLLIYCVAAPGWAFLRWVGFASRSWIDYAIAGAAAGAALTSVTVTVLLLLGVYTRPLAIVLLLVPAISLAWPRRAAEKWIGSDAAAPAVSPIDRALFCAVAAFLAIYLIDAWTSPITWWDGLASWGKWAADWGRRTSSAHYVTGAYPQLVPRIASVLYKITGAHSDVLPLDFFALHGFYVLFAVWFVLGAIRLAELLELPAWPIVLAGVGSIQFREHIAAGTVDVLVAATIVTLLALYLGLRRSEWRARRGPWLILGTAATAAVFTKWTGLLGVAFLLMLHRAPRPPAAPVDVRALGGALRRALALAAVAILPFVIEQGIAELRIQHWRPDPYEVNISARQMPTLLSTDAAVVYRGGDTRQRWTLVQLRFWNSYDVPASLRWVFSAFLAVGLLAAAATWFGRAVLPIVIVDAAIWLVWSSYDQRNLFGVLPVVALCATFGAQRMWTWRPAVIWRNGVALLAGLFLILAGGSVLKDAQARLASLTGGERPLRARLEAARGGTAEKVARFYPGLAADYTFVAALAERTAATHVLVTSPLFRFFPRGSHALSFWPYEVVQPGDVFAAHESHRPPPDPRWVLLWRGPVHRVWLRAAAMRLVTPRTATAPDTGPGTRRLLYDVEPGDTGADGLVVWHADIRGGSASDAAVFEAGPDAPAIDRALTSTICEPAVGVPEATSCSGIVALARPGSLRPGDLRVGVATTAQPAAVSLSVASASAARR